MADDAVRPAPVMPLSDQEPRVLRSFSEGKAPAYIACDLNITPHTLRNQVHRTIGSGQ